MKLIIVKKGGFGSGFRGHRGIPSHQGGSLPGKGSFIDASEETGLQKEPRIRLHHEDRAALRTMATNDYQHRAGRRYPDSGVPDNMDVYENKQYNTITISASFKSTTAQEAAEWMVSHLSRFGVRMEDIYVNHMAGDYPNDWTEAWVPFKTKGRSGK